MNDVWKEFDLDSLTEQEPTVAIMTNGFDHIPENIEMLKESAVANGFNLMLMRHDNFSIGGVFGSWWVLIFVAPKSIAEQFFRFYFENDKDVTLFYVSSIVPHKSEVVFDAGYIEYSNKYIHIPAGASITSNLYDITPAMRFYGNGESQIWKGAYHLEMAIKHDLIGLPQI